MTTAPPARDDRTARLPADPDALIREARRRQRRRYLAIAGALAAAVAGLVSAALAASGSGTGKPIRPTSATSPRPSRPSPPTAPAIPRSVRATVLIWTYQHPTWLERPGSNGFRHSWKPVIAVGDHQPTLIRVGRWLVYVGDGTSAIRDDLSGRPRKLWTRVRGQPQLFKPAAKPGHVWLTFVNGRLWPQGQERARLVSVPAGRPGQSVTLPKREVLVSGTDRGLLLMGEYGRLELWSPGDRPRPLPYSGDDSSFGFAAAPRLIAYGTRCGDAGCPVLRVYDVVTGRLVSVPPPPGTLGWTPNNFNGTFLIAPGNAMMAAAAAARSGGPGVYVVRLTAVEPRVTRVP